jgi:hypothetical protein
MNGCGIDCLIYTFVIRPKSFGMRKLCFAGLLAIFMLCIFENSFGQFNRKSIKNGNKRMASYKGNKKAFGKQKSYNAIGFSINALNYYGDLSPSSKKISTDIAYTRPGFGLSYMKRIGPRYTVMGQFLFGTISGSDAESADPNDLTNGIYRVKRNLSFRNQIKELSAVMIVDFFENNSTYMSRVKWTPYVYLGVAGFLHNPQAIAPATDLTGKPLPQAGQWVDLRPLGTEGQNANLKSTDANYGLTPYSPFQFAIPMGIGARFRLNEVLDLSADIGFRYTFTDYLDDVSKNYVDLTLLDPLAQAMSYRTNEIYGGNPPNPVPSGIPGVNVEAGYGHEYPTNYRGGSKAKDIYMVTSIKISYIISPTYHRAKFR